MSNLLDLLIAGLATGAIYALVAVGFTLLWQTSQTINFAQGEFVMLPAFLMLAVMHAGAPFWLAILIGIALSLLLLGLGFKMLLVDPMLRHGVLPLAIATIGAGHRASKRAVKDFYSSQASAVPVSIIAGGDVYILGAVIVAAAKHWSCSGLAIRRRASACSAVCNRSSIGRHDAGHRAEPDGGAHPRRAGRAHDAADLPDQRRCWSRWPRS